MSDYWYYLKGKNHDEIHRLNTILFDIRYSREELEEEGSKLVERKTNGTFFRAALHVNPKRSSRQLSLVLVSARVVERGKPIHQIVHDISPG